MTTIVVPSVRISDVIIGERYRKDLGDIDALMASIRAIGLLNPIDVDTDNRLIAGYRRLVACQRLGWERLPYYVPTSVTDAASRLRAEQDENTCRKDMTLSERNALAEAIHDIERGKARQRQAHGQTAPGRRANASVPPNGSVHPESREIAAAAVGQSTATYSRIRQVRKAAVDYSTAPEKREKAQEALELMDRVDDGEDIRDADGNKRSVTAIYQAWRGEGAKFPTSTNHPANGQAKVIPLRAPDRREPTKKIATQDMGRRHVPHRTILERAIPTLTGMASAFSYIDKLDGSVTPEEAGQWATDLSLAKTSLSRVERLLKEYSKNGH